MRAPANGKKTKNVGCFGFYIDKSQGGLVFEDCVVGFAHLRDRLRDLKMSDRQYTLYIWPAVNLANLKIEIKLRVVLGYAVALTDRDKEKCMQGYSLSHVFAQQFLQILQIIVQR